MHYGSMSASDRRDRYSCRRMGRVLAMLNRLSKPKMMMRKGHTRRTRRAFKVLRIAMIILKQSKNRLKSKRSSLKKLSGLSSVALNSEQLQKKWNL